MKLEAPASQTSASPMVPAALLTDCPSMASTFERLGPLFGKSGPAHQYWQKCSAATEPIELASEVRSKLNGAALAIVGVSSEAGGDAMRTILAASRSHQCVVVMTLEGQRAFVDFCETLSPVDRIHLSHRIVAVVLVGDRQEFFTSFSQFAPKARIRHIGGMHWSEKTCEEMAAFIRGDPA